MVGGNIFIEVIYLKKFKKKILAVGLAIGVVLGSIGYCPSDSYVDAYSKTSTKYWTQKTGKKVRKVKKITCKIYHYTSLASENGGSKYAGRCTLGKLNSKTIANNYWSLGRNMYIEGYGMKVVRDRGGRGLNTPYKLDVYVPRKKGESNRQYKKRVNRMGVKKKTCYVIYYK